MLYMLPKTKIRAGYKIDDNKFKLEACKCYFIKIIQGLILRKTP